MTRFTGVVPGWFAAFLCSVVRDETSDEQAVSEETTRQLFEIKLGHLWCRFVRREQNNLLTTRASLAYCGGSRRQARLAHPRGQAKFV